MGSIVVDLVVHTLKGVLGETLPLRALLAEHRL
jgi:hypothetical protein